MRVSAVFPSYTPVAVADTVAMTTLGFHNVQGGVSTQRMEVRDIIVQGQAPSTSSPTFLVGGRTSTVGAATLTAGRLACVDPSSVLIANPPVSYQVTSGAYPQRSATLGMLVGLTINAYGGACRWQPGPDEIIATLGATASFGEFSINAFTGGTPGLVMTTLILEVV